MKKFFTLILAVMASVGIILAEGVQIGDLYYNLNFSNKTAEVTYQYDGSHDNYSNLKTVSIPSSVVCYDDTFSVTSIGERAFLYCKSLTSIEIPNSITSIGWAAFIECTSLPIIDNIRYADTYLVEAVNKSLSSYSIKEGTKWIGDKAFCTCTKLTSIEIPNSVISIGVLAFSDCYGLTSVEIPNSVISIGDAAFAACSNLTSVKFGNSVTNIGSYAFRACTSLPITDNIRYADTYLVEVVDKSLSSYSIKEGTKWIGDEAFKYCEKMTTIELPNSVISLGYGAFSCTCLTSVTIGNSITSIGSGAFSYCPYLTSITIPNSVTSIGYGAFEHCTALTSIEIPNSVISIGWYAFSWCEGLTFIEIPNSVTYLGDYAFEYCTALTSVNIGNGITKIGYYAFRNCSGLTNVIIGNNVTYIGHGAFEYCRSLTSIKIPQSVHNMGYDVFYYCTGLTSITSEAVTPPYLGDKVFYEVNKSIPLYVPAESITAYEAANQWKDFYNILALEEANEVVYDTSENQKLSSKLLRDNQILILRGEKTYTLTGQQVR